MLGRHQASNAAVAVGIIADAPIGIVDARRLDARRPRRRALAGTPEPSA
jgi:hypothetical protein